MKARLPHRFFIYASQFTTKSMIKAVSYWAFETFKNPQDKLKYISRREKYEIDIGGKTIRNEVMLVQNWLVDMIYVLACHPSLGKKEISQTQALHLIALYNDYDNLLDSKRINQDNVLLYVLGAFGEQFRFQNPQSYMGEFSREKYILDNISYKSEKAAVYNIDVKKEFFDITGFTTDEYPALVFALWGLFSQKSPFASKPLKVIEYKDTVFSIDNMMKVLSNYTINFNDIINSPLERQVFYTKPIVEFDDEYVCTNPLLLLALFTNCIYWCLRNKYFVKGSQDFINAFGCYFETYVDELLENTLDKKNYKRLSETDKEKRADLYIKLGEYEFIVEQKSALSSLRVKQSHPDIEEMKKHFIKTWGKAIEQLESTQKYLKLSNPIKIILIYEDYYKGNMLKQFFDVCPEYKNDNKYWLVSITEFETLLQLYRSSPGQALKIIKEKDEAHSSPVPGKIDLSQFFSEENVNQNQYLINHKIYDEEFDYMRKLCQKIDFSL